MVELGLDARRLNLIRRLENLKTKLEELLYVDDNTLDFTAISQYYDFEGSKNEFYYITKRIDDIDNGFVNDISLTISSFLENVDPEKFLTKGNLIEVKSFLRNCKDLTTDMLGILKPNEDDLFSQLKKCRGDYAQLREDCKNLKQTRDFLEQEVKNLTSKDIKVGSVKELARDLIDNKFKEPMRKQKKENMENILIVLLENKNDKLDTSTIKSKTNIKSKDTVRKICIELYEKEFIERSMVLGSHNWTYKDR